MSKLLLIDGDVPKRVDSNGYIRGSNDSYEHRNKAEKALGRRLNPRNIIHHVDGNRTNNKNSNLVICEDQAYHLLLHARQRVVELGGNPNKDKWCSYHKCLHPKSMFSTSPSKYDGLFNTCRDATNEYRKERGLNKNKFDWRARVNQQFRRAIKSNKQLSIIGAKQEGRSL